MIKLTLLIKLLIKKLLFENKSNETKKKVEIIFRELDEDSSNSISIEEIKNSFTTKYPN
jgi:hypothetical protein